MSVLQVVKRDGGCALHAFQTIVRPLAAEGGSDRGDGDCSRYYGGDGDGLLDCRVSVHEVVHDGFLSEVDVIIAPVIHAMLLKERAKKGKGSVKSPIPLASVQQMGFFVVDEIGFHRAEELRHQFVDGFGFLFGDDRLRCLHDVPFQRI